MSERGEIKYPQRAGQLRDFSGLLYGRITPTDIDGLIEYQDRAYVLIELKMTGVRLPYGQRLALERMCHDWIRAGKQVLLIIAEHNTPTEQSIDVASTTVVEYQYNGITKTGDNCTTKSLIDRFLEYVNRTL
ncbi:MAG: hypothetical protein IPO08_20285 [Xanthomonadales bacterium]|nr:hypothetical protein [Xanthomonadales bacterium]